MIRKYAGLFVGTGITFFNFWILFVFLPALWSSSHLLFLIAFMTVTSFFMMAIGLLEVIAFFTNQNSGLDILVDWLMRKRHGKV